MLAVSRFVLRHKLAVVAFWIVVLAGGVFASSHLSGRLSGQFALPSAPSYKANQQILRIYGNGGDGYPEVVMVTLPPGEAATAPKARPSATRPAALPAASPGGSVTMTTSG